ncbi:hypothetical protein OsI_00121 [Oryza sativa Indica Group]|uniref:Protein kinase domain-containing protein n=1 Tax=Oryza sativa subsp. indica TaxID=39946 RepID=A2WJX1_ORYSI|nr:hypothetical protein OsI_00121 [Oryza sativa Indica Group]
MKKDNMLWKATVEHAEQCDLEGNYKLKSYRVEEKHVTLFFNCVHDLVGAKFRGRYVAKDNFSSDEKIHEEEQELEEITLQGMPRRFTFQQLQEATDQFRDKLGEGGFGSVFLGRIGGERVAVKRLDRSGQGMREFLAEVQTIGSIHHINLVRLIGFCAEKSQRLLVYEHMPKGSLDRWIYPQQGVAIVPSVPPLDWQTRHKIITQVAKGLSYLHEECTKRIAHLDVKPQNILLDDNSMLNSLILDYASSLIEIRAK